VNLNARVITLPADRCKNGRPHSIPLSEPALAILSARASRATDEVFTPGDWVAKKAALDRRLGPGFPHFVLHDCRRSVASGMAKLGINLPVIERVLNHVSGSFAGIVGVYQRHDFADEKRAALERWAAHVAKLIGEPAGLTPTTATPTAAAIAREAN
jgi:integrase